MDSAMEESHGKSTSLLCLAPAQQGVAESHKEEGLLGSQGVVPKDKSEKMKGKCHVIPLSCSQKSSIAHTPCPQFTGKQVGDCPCVHSYDLLLFCLHACVILCTVKLILGGTCFYSQQSKTHQELTSPCASFKLFMEQNTQIALSMRATWPVYPPVRKAVCGPSLKHPRKQLD